MGRSKFITKYTLFFKTFCNNLNKKKKIEIEIYSSRLFQNLLLIEYPYKYNSENKNSYELKEIIKKGYKRKCIK